MKRSEITHRAETVWPLNSVPYSQSALRGGYRQDCSGYVSLVAGIPASAGWGGENTVSLVTDGWVREIPINDLRPGDFVGLLGPGTAGDAGHVQVFCGWDNSIPNDNGHTVLEQSGPTGSPGPHRRHYATWRAGYRAYRLVGLVEDPTAPAPAPAPAARPYPLKGWDVFGPRQDPRSWVHGGYNEWEREPVRAIQARLTLKGYPCGPIDGDYGSRTSSAVGAYQRACGLVADGLVGPRTWTRLFS